MVGRLHQELQQKMELGTRVGAGAERSLTFDEWLDVTLELERVAFGQDPPSFEGDRLGDFFLAMGHAAGDEIHEMMGECGWKTWTLDRGWYNREAFISEAADVLHFVALLLAAVDCTGEELSRIYLTKVLKNYKRQEGGDDEKLRRCPGCKRSLDDVGVDELITGNAFCRACRTEVKGRT